MDRGILRGRLEKVVQSSSDLSSKEKRFQIIQQKGKETLDGIWTFGGPRVPLRGNAGTAEYVRI